jgi:RHS repeat-associated protein
MQASYDSFGEASVSGTVTQNLRLPGQYFDVESGWNHNGFRNYLPDLGRYAEPDPLAIQGNAVFYDSTAGKLFARERVGLDFQINPYAYGFNAPSDYIDPAGLSPCKKSCDDLLNDINQLRNELAERIDDYNNPRWNLPLVGKMSRAGHVQKIEEAQDKLRKALGDYNTQGCPGSGLPADAWSLATQPVTLSPSPSHLPLPPWAKLGVGVGIGLGVGAGAILCPECFVVAPAFAF